MRSPLRPLVPAMVLLALSNVLVGAAAPASGVLVVTIWEFDTDQSPFDASSDNQGWYSDRDRNDDLNDNYFVGLQRKGEFRNFFTFDLAGLAGQVGSAELMLTRYDSGGDRFETYSLFDVSTRARRLNDNDNMVAEIFDDLGSGDSHGSFEIRKRRRNPETVLLTSLDEGGTQFRFGASSGAGVPRLVVRTL